MSDRNSTQKNWTSWHHLLHKEILRNKTLIPNGANILIAVSGGQDSMALLNLINDLKKQHDWSLSVWHGDHQWHEKSSICAFELKSYCEDKNISFFSDKANKENIFSEEKARDWRYQKLSEKAKYLLIEKQLNNFYLLTGHTSTDNAETFILNLCRGSNYAGVSNIESKRLIEPKIFLIRPILIFSRADTKNICESMNIPIWKDPTNTNLKIKRNLIRQKVIPTLESIYPRCSTRINIFSKKMSAFKDERDDLSELALLCCRDQKGLKRDLLNKICIEARATIINKFLKEFFKRQLSSQNLSELATSIFNKDKGQIYLPENFKITWNKNYINVKQI